MIACCLWIAASLALMADVRLDKEDDGVVYSPHRAFKIPLDISDQDRALLGSIRLYVSDDDGKTWMRKAELPKDATMAPFVADKDGAYQFIVALVDKEGRQSPESTEGTSPGLSVVVDTQPPLLIVKPVRNKAGERGIRWELKDDDLDLATLKFAVWESEAGGWIPLEVDRVASKLHWFDEQRSIKRVQAVVKDRAGNQSLIEIHIDGERFAKKVPERFALSDDANAKGLVKSNAGATSGQPTPSAHQGAKDEWPTSGASSPKSRGKSSEHDIPATTAAESSASDTSSLADTNETRLNGISTPDQQNTSPLDSATRSRRRPPESTGSGESTASRHRLPLAEVGESSAVARETTDSLIPPPPRVSSPTTEVVAKKPVNADLSSLSSRAAPRSSEHKMNLSKAKKISVNYEVERGGSSPTIVELWGTRDRGETWRRLARDEDLKSPVEAELSEQGVWGLSIVVASGPGDHAPKPGVEPEAYVEVDTDPPVVEITSVVTQQGQAIIKWSASDKNLGATPVDLFFSRHPSGPWRKIAGKLENTGEHLWNYARDDVSGRCYFRVRATDGAGNVAVADTSKETNLIVLESKGRVLDVTPAPSDDAATQE